MTKLRLRQHVNPLRDRYKIPITLPKWQEIYRQYDLPLHLDIGCARGEFLLQMAQIEPEINFLGVEIRQPLVVEANKEKTALGLTNLHYLFCNINVAAENLLQSLPPLHYITIQFPDPWFKRKHMKRRVVQPELVRILVKHLINGGRIFLQSDIKDVALEMRDRFGHNPLLVQQHEQTWLGYNPFPVPTERESYVIEDHKSVYRVLFQKKVT
ncbi:MAG: tRNA (guanosine(46)-N7)-methyltransferase TrmB [Xenococcaceae cyanobacterium MO_188.B19]|nr:tRNA (guanosine(46)-N7)-methyltransferase TrmB [Xenococcaceae cyanobacterium MO_188.B19]MDJ0680189.1 tRNA (guanosine(46)-N7)-methyltransferase TrmB [Xenococcaceae cyanobacterium MO_167.B52]